MKKKLLFVVMVFAILITACASPTVVPATQPEPTQPPPTITSTIAPTATFTPLPTATDTPVILPSATATVTLEPTPAVDFGTLKISSMETTSAEAMWVMFTANGLKEGYSAKINKQEYYCQPVKKITNSLVCTGARYNFADYVNIEFFGPDGEEPIYSTRMQLPSAKPATPTPVGVPQTWCPLRGTKVTCETEHRFELDGTPCEVTSCFDACGYYYSIHTCSETAVFHLP